LGSRKGIRPVKTERWGAGVVICLEQGGDLHMAQLMPLPLTVSLSLVSVKSRLVLPFWCQLTRAVPDKGPLNRCVCVFINCTTSLRLLTKYKNISNLDTTNKIMPTKLCQESNRVCSGASAAFTSNTHYKKEVHTTVQLKSERVNKII